LACSQRGQKSPGQTPGLNIQSLKPSVPYRRDSIEFALGWPELREPPVPDLGPQGTKNVFPTSGKISLAKHDYFSV
jgi:hypothetical protein